MKSDSVLGSAPDIARGVLSGLACVVMCLVPLDARAEEVYPVPLQAERWHSLQFSSIPANEVAFADGGVVVTVRQSASPLIFPLTDNPLNVKAVSVSGAVDRLVNIAAAETQGAEGADDFNLKLGLVFLGERTLSWYQAAIAADWVKQMFDLAPKDQGIDHIFFLNAVLSPSLLDKRRDHPSTEYIKERNVWLLDRTGAFSYTHTLPEPKPTVALWLSVDGDDTGSEYTITIDEITLTH